MSILLGIERDQLRSGGGCSGYFRWRLQGFGARIRVVYADIQSVYSTYDSTKVGLKEAHLHQAQLSMLYSLFDVLI